MSFWEALALVGTMATILGVFIAIYGLINNRLLKKEAGDTRQILQDQAKGLREIIQEEAKNTREILLRIEQGQTEARKEMAEAIRYVADLIRVESDKTRETVRARP